MEERAIGIILQTRPLTESSLIVQWLTKDSGRLSTVAKGARRPQSTFQGKLDLFFEVEFSFVRSRRSELHTLREAGIRHTFAPLRKDIDLLRQASYAAQLIQSATEVDAPVPEIYPILHWFLGELGGAAKSPWHVLRFEWRLLEHLGYGPDPSHPLARALDPSTLEAWLGEPATDPIDSESSLSFRRALSRFLASHISEAFGKLPRLRMDVVPT